MCHPSEYGCWHPAPWHHPWGCCAPGWTPHIPTREETLRGLEEYLSYLQTAVKEVEERITELKKEG